MKKQSQIQSQVFVYILGAILLVLILVFGYKSIGSYGDKVRKANIIQLESDIKSGVDFVSGEYGAAKQSELRVPADTDMICFIDLSKRDILLQSEVAITYADIKENLQDYVLKNVFLISQGRVTDMLYVGNLCFDIPFYKCIETPQHIIKVLFKGRKDCVDILKPIPSIKINNIKNTSRYSRNPIFFYEDSTSITDRQNMLRLVPIAMWNNKANGITTYPYYIYYEQGGQPSTQFYVAELMTTHNSGELRFFKTPPASLVGHSNVSYEQFTETNYRGYWRMMIDVVITNTSNTNDGLISSLFSSYLIAPLIFVDKNTINTYAGYFNGTRVYSVGQIDNEVRSYITTHSRELLEYDSRDIREDAQINPYQQLLSNVTPSSHIS